MRKRVLLKSPVQPVRGTGEDRTPGSVRGLSGNWQSYRDGGRKEVAARWQARRSDPPIPNLVISVEFLLILISACGILSQD
jgi:hypothetical protein